MIFKKPVADIIKARSSRRSYILKELEPETRNKLIEYLSGPHKGPFGHEARFGLIEKKPTEKSQKVKLGTYGFISGVRYFIAGVIQNIEGCMEDYGYLFEKLILFATDNELGTCWCGGIFTRGEFSKALKLKPGEVIPGITPIGYPTEKRSTRDKLIRLGAGSKARKPWNELFFDGKPGVPLSAENAGAFSAALEMVRLAPSASNRQPWRIIKDKASFHFFLSRTKGYKNMVKAADLQKVDMGIAMCHFELTARELKLPGKWVKNDSMLGEHKDIEYIVSWDGKP